MNQIEFEESAWNVVKKLVFYYAIGFLFMTAINAVLAHWTDFGRDETDPPDGRSDMRILTDHMTGCQYLSPSRGGATPRLTADGVHICGPINPPPQQEPRHG